MSAHRNGYPGCPGTVYPTVLDILRSAAHRSRRVRQVVRPCGRRSSLASPSERVALCHVLDRQEHRGLHPAFAILPTIGRLSLETPVECIACLRGGGLNTTPSGTHLTPMSP